MVEILKFLNLKYGISIIGLVKRSFKMSEVILDSYRITVRNCEFIGIEEQISCDYSLQ